MDKERESLMFMGVINKAKTNSGAFVEDVQNFISLYTTRAVGTGTAETTTTTTTLMDNQEP